MRERERACGGAETGNCKDFKSKVFVTTRGERCVRTVERRDSEMKYLCSQGESYQEFSFFFSLCLLLSSVCMYVLGVSGWVSSVCIVVLHTQKSRLFEGIQDLIPINTGY